MEMEKPRLSRVWASPIKLYYTSERSTILPYDASSFGRRRNDTSNIEASSRFADTVTLSIESARYAT
jgi:hypothetical protein